MVGNRRRCTGILGGMALEVIDALRGNYLMQGLDARQIDSVAALATVGEFSGGDTLLRQFSDDADLMIVIDGKAVIRGFSGEVIAEAGPGSVIGEISLIDQKPRSATVVSAGGTKVASINNKDLWNLMNVEPEIGKTLLLNIGRILCARLRAANVAIDSVVDRTGV